MKMQLVAQSGRYITLFLFHLHEIGYMGEVIFPVLQVNTHFSYSSLKDFTFLITHGSKEEKLFQTNLFACRCPKVK